MCRQLLAGTFFIVNSYTCECSSTSIEKIDGISSVKIDSITETNEALTKKKQYSYTITFAYNKVVDANEKASEIEGSQTE